MAKKPNLATRAAMISKTILGGGAAAPRMVRMPKAVHEIHVSPEEVIPAGTILTEQLADLAKLDDEAVERLLEIGAIVMTEVLASAAEAAAADADAADAE